MLQNHICKKICDIALKYENLLNHGSKITLEGQHFGKSFPVKSRTFNHQMMNQNMQTYFPILSGILDCVPYWYFQTTQNTLHLNSYLQGQGVNIITAGLQSAVISGQHHITKRNFIHSSAFKNWKI